MMNGLRKGINRMHRIKTKSGMKDKSIAAMNSSPLLLYPDHLSSSLLIPSLIEKSGERRRQRIIAR
jgi:hypothetical protein